MMEIDLETFGSANPPRTASSIPGARPVVMSGSSIEQDYLNNPDRLYNDNLAPGYRRKSERPEHRLIVMLKAQGLSNKEIAARMEMTVVAVSEILRQPYARHRLVEEITTAGRDGINELLRGEVENSIFTLIDVRTKMSQKDDAKSLSVAASAANALLDRFLGKPVQHVESKVQNVPYDSESVSDLDRKIAETQQQIATLTGSDQATSTSSPPPVTGPNAKPLEAGETAAHVR